MGRMTLNPLVHFDPLGAIMLVYMAIGGRGIGWGKPVPVNPFNLQGNRRVSMGLTAVAGPFSNLLLATLAAIPLRLGLHLPAVISSFVWTLVITNVSLAMFNLIPLPPLDGFSVIQGLLGTGRSRSAYEWGERLDRLAPYGPYVLLLLLSLGWFAGLDVLGRILGPPVNAIISLLVG
jgi:Zn-dependent protease